MGRIFKSTVFNARKALSTFKPLEEKNQQICLIKFLKKLYKKYILKQKDEHKKVCEDIDNPDACPELIKAAECYLEHGEVYYEGKKDVPVRSAIQQFIDSHPMTEEAKEEAKPPQLAEVNQ
jgi:hypothetical protein